MDLRNATIVLATANKHKVEELRTMLGGLAVRIISAAEAGFVEEIDETGATLEENALLKARRVAEVTGTPALADDTGLEVDILDGAPGVYSARFAGPGCSPADNRALLLHKLSGMDHERRHARFRCVLAFVNGTEEILFSGECAGYISTTERGAGGFGYDAIFLPDGDNRTLAEMGPDEKNAISHRGRAVRAFAEYLRRQIGG